MSESETEKSPREIAERLLADQKFDAHLTVADKMCLSHAITFALYEYGCEVRADERKLVARAIETAINDERIRTWQKAAAAVKSLFSGGGEA